MNTGEFTKAKLREFEVDNPLTHIEQATIKLECTNCHEQEDLPENPSIDRVEQMAQDFWLNHAEDRDCTRASVFIRTFQV